MRYRDTLARGRLSWIPLRVISSGYFLNDFHVVVKPCVYRTREDWTIIQIIPKYAFNKPHTVLLPDQSTL